MHLCITHLERVEDLVPPTRSQHPVSGAPDSWSGPGKEVKVRGGGREKAKVPRAAEQKPRTRPCRQSPSTGRQLGGRTPGKGKGRRCRGGSPREVGTHPARLVSQLLGCKEPLLTLGSEPQPETPGGSGLSVSPASGFWHQRLSDLLATIPELASVACGPCTSLPRPRASAEPLPRCLFPEPGPSPPPPCLQRARTPPPEAHSLLSKQAARVVQEIRTRSNFRKSV